MLGSVCLPAGMARHEVEQLDQLVQERVRLQKGQLLYQNGDKLDALYSLRLGSIKTQLEEASGQVQITGFFLPGEVIGLDGMPDGHHSSNALALGSMRSEARLAAFLLNLSERMSALGYSSTDFLIRMSREEIGNYLGLTLETVSRLFSRFAREGLITVNQREVKLLDLSALKELTRHPT
jgi:CRP/FNR family transcriptional regulator, anaerobic regulatory protein